MARVKRSVQKKPSNKKNKVGFSTLIELIQCKIQGWKKNHGKNGYYFALEIKNKLNNV